MNSILPLGLVCGLLGCMPPAKTGAASSGGSVPVATAGDPFAGLPAVSGDGRTIALPTFTMGEQGQERSIAFLEFGSVEAVPKTLGIPTAPPTPFLESLNNTLREKQFITLPWTLSSDDPQLPLAMTMAGVELQFAGDPHAILELAVMANGASLGRDRYQLEAESQTSPERIVAVGATVVWTKERGFAYVRYDVNDGVGRDSDWRIVELHRPATTSAPTPAE